MCRFYWFLGVVGVYVTLPVLALDVAYELERLQGTLNVLAGQLQAGKKVSGPAEDIHIEIYATKDLPGIRAYL
jgi:hypothetical protein